MTSISIDDFEHFLTDPNLAAAIEAAKRVDDVFDIINPNENQHSCILEWLFDPREGHGQGEAIFKDFLIAVHSVNAKSAKPQKLFKRWTPARIAITGFQSLIVVREKAILDKGRQDLLLVDPIHKFVILVENKSGSRWQAGQLTDYRTSLARLTQPKAAYAGFETGVVLLDRLKEESPTNHAELNHWVYIDYCWLEKAARRAEAQVERGLDSGQQVVISYCRRQAGYESEEERELDGTLARLSQSHRPTVLALRDARRRKNPTKLDLGGKSIDSQLWIWAHQHKDLVTKLVQQKALSFLKTHLVESASDETPVFDMRKRAAFIIGQSWDVLREQESNYGWPVRIKVLQLVDDDGIETRNYTIAVEFIPEWLAQGLESKVRVALAKHYSKDLKVYTSAWIRRLGRIQVNEDQLPKKVLEVFQQLNDSLRPLTAS